MTDVLNIIAERKEWFLGLIAQHLMLAGIAIILAGSMGLLLGILIYEKKKLSSIVLSITNILYTIPDIAMFGFLIPLTGIGNKTAIVALTIYSLLPMIRNTYIGLDQVDPDIVEAATGMGSTKLQMLLKIQLPLASPVILTGIRQMVVMAVSIAGIASFIGAGGLGQAIYRGIATNNMQLMLAGSLIIAIIAILLDILLGLCEAKPGNKNGTKKRIVAIAVLITIFSATLIGHLSVEKKQITVGYDNTAEEAIIANMLILLIENNTDITVKEMGNMAGGETVLHPAAVHGDIDIYPEYTGTAWLTILKHKNIPKQDVLNRKLQFEFNKKYSLSWVGMYGFDDSYGIAVTKKVADEYNLQTYSDLAKVSGNIRFGAEPGFFERKDGFNALCEKYGFRFKSHSDITFSLKYDAIMADKVDAIIIFTTDGRLKDSDLVVLKDDKEYFPKYLCGNVVRNGTLKKYPELEDVLNMTEDILNANEMSKLNRAVEVDGQEPATVAKNFLIEKGLL